MKKILIIGCRGMAGHVVTEYLKNKTDWDIHTLSRSGETKSGHYNLDIRDLQEIRKVLSNRYDTVLNFVGILNHYAEANPEEAVFVNAYFPHFLARQGEEFGHRLIHLSTDCVFSGSRGGYKESDYKDATGYYAVSKALGEVSYGPHLTCRTSIIGPEVKESGIGLFHWFSKQEGEINGYAHAIWTGVTTLELSRAIHHFILSGTSGLYHLVNGKGISKFDLLNLFAKYYKKSKVNQIKPSEEYRTDKSLINSRNDVDFEVSSYDQMVFEMMEWIEKYPDFYPHYQK